MDAPETLPVVRQGRARRPEESDRPVLELHAERGQFLKRRWRGQALDGRAFGFDLVERLRDGMVIWEDDEGLVLIRQIPESVLRIDLPHGCAAGRIGWMLGNLHQPVEFAEEVLFVADDPAVRRLLAGEGLSFIVERRIFQPLRVAAHAAS